MTALSDTQSRAETSAFQTDEAQFRAYQHNTHIRPPPQPPDTRQPSAHDSASEFSAQRQQMPRRFFNAPQFAHARPRFGQQAQMHSPREFSPTHNAHESAFHSDARYRQAPQFSSPRALSHSRYMHEPPIEPVASQFNDSVPPDAAREQRAIDAPVHEQLQALTQLTQQIAQYTLQTAQRNARERVLPKLKPPQYDPEATDILSHIRDLATQFRQYGVEADSDKYTVLYGTLTPEMRAEVERFPAHVREDWETLRVALIERYSERGTPAAASIALLAQLGRPARVQSLNDLNQLVAKFAADASYTDMDPLTLDTVQMHGLRAALPPRILRELLLRSEQPRDLPSLVASVRRLFQANRTADLISSLSHRDHVQNVSGPQNALPQPNAQPPQQAGAPAQQGHRRRKRRAPDSHRHGLSQSTRLEQAHPTAPIPIVYEDVSGVSQHFAGYAVFSSISGSPSDAERARQNAPRRPVPQPRARNTQARASPHRENVERAGQNVDPREAHRERRPPVPAPRARNALQRVEREANVTREIEANRPDLEPIEQQSASQPVQANINAYARTSVDCATQTDCEYTRATSDCATQTDDECSGAGVDCATQTDCEHARVVTDQCVGAEKAPHSAMLAPAMLIAQLLFQLFVQWPLRQIYSRAQCDEAALPKSRKLKTRAAQITRKYLGDHESGRDMQHRRRRRAFKRARPSATMSADADTRTIESRAEPRAGAADRR